MHNILVFHCVGNSGAPRNLLSQGLNIEFIAKLKTEILQKICMKFGQIFQYFFDEI